MDVWICVDGTIARCGGILGVVVVRVFEFSLRRMKRMGVWRGGRGGEGGGEGDAGVGAGVLELLFLTVAGVCYCYCWLR